MIGLDTLYLGCPHGSKSTPQTCSQCLGARAREVRISDGMVSLDGNTLGSLRELNDVRRHEESGIPRPLVKSSANDRKFPRRLRRNKIRRD